MIEGQVANSFARQPLARHLDSCDGKTLGELDVAGVFERLAGKSKVTGVAGNVIEQSVLGIAQNSRQEPDIVIDGVQYEVKTTGLRESRQSGELEAKEPMSITAVSPHEIVHEKYAGSHFWAKIAHMVIFYYHYASHETVAASEYSGFPLLSHEFHEYGDFTEEERETLRSDWNRVRNFIIHLNNTLEHPEDGYPGLSHDLRQELMLLDTAPKWPHPPRFRFKRRFVTAMWHRHEATRRELEALPDRYTSVRDIDDKCAEIIAAHKGASIGELCTRFGIEVSRVNKSVAEQVIVRMFGGTKKKMRDVELFEKIGLEGKSIVLTRTGKRTEDVKFFTIDFAEFSDGGIEFEESQFCDYFTQRKFLFIVFEEPDVTAPLVENKLVGFSLVAFDGDFIENHIRRVWERIRHLVQDGELRDEAVVDCEGNPVRNKNGELRTAPNLPKSSEGLVFVRGTGADSSDKPVVVNGVRMYRQQLWIKGSYIAQMLWQRLSRK